MGQPAARLGDSTAHGGVIVAGAPNVFIGKMPAARVGDMHVCPLLTPGLPPIPHVGMPIVKGSSGVMIGGMPAARMGDMAPCVGPPDSIIVGCPTVMIGETMPGGGGGGAGSAQASQASVGAAMSAAIADITPQPETQEDHFLDLTFEDKAGFPIGGVRYELTDPEDNTTSGKLSGQIKRTGVIEGEYTVKLRAICGARWATRQAQVGEKVEMLADFAGFEDGEKATFEVMERNFRRPDKRITVLENVEISDGKAQAEITYEIDDEEETTAADKIKGYSAPEYFFIVSSGGEKMRSGLLEFKDWIEIELRDEDGEVCAGEEYHLHIGDGSIRKGKLDDKGYAKEENIPPGICIVKFPAMAQKQFLEVELLDEDGKPMADEPFELKLLDGKIFKGKLDGNGYIKIERFDAETCQIRFPNFKTTEETV